MFGTSKKAWRILLVLFCIAVILRMIQLNSMLVGDDGALTTIAKENAFFGAGINRRPLGNLLLISATSLFGFSHWSFKLPVFVFSIGTILLVFFYAKKEYGESAALWAVFFLTFSAWHIYGSTTNIGGEGLVAFFILLSSVTFLHAAKSQKWWEYFCVGILVSAGIFVKETAVLLLGIFFIYLCIQRMAVKKIVYGYSWMCLGIVLCISLLLAADLAFNNLALTHSFIQDVTVRSVQRIGYIEPEPIHYVFSFFKVAVWCFPLFGLFFILWFFQKQQKTWYESVAEKIKDFNVIFLLISGVFFMFYINPVFDKSRYLLITAPFFSIIAGRYCAEYMWTKKQIAACAILVMLFFSLLLLLNSERNIISFDDMGKIFENIRSGQLNFDIGLVFETGNSGIILNMRTFLLAQGLGICFAVLYFIFRSSSYSRWFLILFLSIAIAYNCFLIGELVCHFTSPDYENAAEEIQNYALTHTLDEPIYVVKDPSLAYHVEKKYQEFINVDTIQNSEERIAEIQQIMQKQGGTVLLVDIPFINKEGALWQLFGNCNELLRVSDKNIDVGYIFDCRNMQTNFLSSKEVEN